MFARLPTIGHAETEASFNLPRVQKRAREKEREKFLGQIFSKYFDLFYPMDHCFSFFFFFFREGRLTETFLFRVKKMVSRMTRERNFSFFYLKFLSFISFF